MRVRSWKFRLGLLVSSTLIGAGAMAPVATAAPALPSHTVEAPAGQQQVPAPGGGDNQTGGNRFGRNGAIGKYGDQLLGKVKLDKDSVRVGDKVCAGKCNGSVNGTEGGNGGICAGLCNGSANGGTGATGRPGGGTGGTGGNGGVCAGVCHGSVNGGDGGTGGAASPGGDGGEGGLGGDGGICVGVGCGTSGFGGRGGNGGMG
ncbi:hypothetical protein PV721_35950 [Streptomyces sp. MB09-01]|uniref:hypothetical protein n=1 Tax=Streptomyces sp. MB09-01 TaxID=3028666 RepID=UPI0029BBD284|nr:hypothetical protein [Streptomyces sp. MB09-01]MDX3539630.1 hypothetical protein [Streptomyces sp. MB09-01]